MRTLLVAAALLSLPCAQASAIDYTTTGVGVFQGISSTEYDSISGLTQVKAKAPTVDFTSNPANDTPGAISSSESANASWNPGIPLTASGTANADPATLTLGVSSSGSFNPRPNLPPDGGDTYALAVMQNVFTFNNTTGGTQDITVSFQFTNTITGTSLTLYPLQNQFCFGPGDACLSTGTTPIGLGVLTIPDNRIQIQNQFSITYLLPYSFALTSVGGGGPVSPSEGDPDTAWSGAMFDDSIIPGANPYSGTYTGTFAVPAGQSTASLFADLQDYCGGATCNSTGSVSFSLPNGVTFTSSSGALVAPSPGTATPEPPSWSMATAAIFVLFGVGRRRTFAAVFGARD